MVCIAFGGEEHELAFVKGNATSYLLLIEKVIEIGFTRTEPY